MHLKVQKLRKHCDLKDLYVNTFKKTLAAKTGINITSCLCFEQNIWKFDRRKKEFMEDK